MPGNQLRVSSGQANFASGVDSSKPPSLASQPTASGGPGINPHGLKQDQLSWLNNGTVRGGTIQPRFGWKRLAAFQDAPGIKLSGGLHQESQMYQPDDGFPYIISQISGRTFTCRVDTDNSIHDISVPADFNPSTLDQAWMCQGEQFMMIQDNVSTPLVWDGTTLRRISTMLNVNPKFPTCGPMDYYQGRFWGSRGREIIGSDIVQGPSGTGTIAPDFQGTGYRLRDSILSVFENQFERTGGTITVPSSAGNIRALAHTANLDSSLGEGTLFAFTRKSIYSVNVVPTRAEWITMTQPIVRIANINYGTTSDRSIVKVNGDLFFQSPYGVESLTMAIRNFTQWGQTGISKEENRVIKYNDRALLKFGCGIEFDNRCLQTCLPFQTDRGVAHLGIMPLDFDIISTLAERLPPAWEGMLEGLDILRLLEADFGGRQRAFAVVHSRITQGIEIWELTTGELTDNGDNRITMRIEFPSHDFNTPFRLKELDAFELFVDQLYGTCEFLLEYREGRNPCWRNWGTWTECAARNNCEIPGVPQPCDYPTQPYSLQYRATMVVGKPPAQCDSTNARPSDISYSFQPRLTIKGSCRVLAYALHAFERDKAPYENLVC